MERREKEKKINKNMNDQTDIKQSFIVHEIDIEQKK